MEIYKDLNGDSGVSGFDTGDGWIIVHFERGGSYRYTAYKPGSDHVVEMTRLARAGDGLNAYINKYVRKNYEEKL